MEVFHVGSDAPASVEAVVRVESFGPVHEPGARHDFLRGELPTGDVLVQRLVVEVRKTGIFQIILVPRPFIHFQACLHYVRVGAEVVPELIVIFIVYGSRLVVAVDFPIRAPVFLFADVFHKVCQHVFVMPCKA